MNFKNVYLSVVLALFAVCTASAQKSDYDKDTDFTKYTSYSFIGWEKNSDQQLNDFDKKRIVDAVEAEMAARGLERKDEGGDLAVTGFVVVEQESSTTAYTSFNGALGYSARWGWGMGPGMSEATTQYEESDYTEGTILIDMYDAEGKNLVWQGNDQEVIKSKPQRRDKQIPKIIKGVFEGFPISLSN